MMNYVIDMRNGKKLPPDREYEGEKAGTRRDGDKERGGEEG